MLLKLIVYSESYCTKPHKTYLIAYPIQDTIPKVSTQTQIHTHTQTHTYTHTHTHNVSHTSTTHTRCVNIEPWLDSRTADKRLRHESLSWSWCPTHFFVENMNEFGSVLDNECASSSCVCVLECAKKRERGRQSCWYWKEVNEFEKGTLSCVCMCVCV